MLLSMICFFILATFLLHTNTCAVGIAQREPCAETYTTCSPPGATNSIVPPVGDALSGLYFDLVSSVDPQPVIRDIAADKALHQTRDTPTTICCTQGTECRLLQSYNLAFCWDRFTTNFFLPDGSFGNVFTGHYSSSSGAIANLVSGDIALPDGHRGNIYSDTPQAKPATSLLPVPTPWTNVGVGTAIPDSQLGAAPTYPGTPAQATTTLTTPTNGVAFPALTPTGGPIGASASVNATGLPAYPTASIGEPYGYGPTPASNNTLFASSTRLAPANLIGASYSMIYLMLLVCLV